MAENERAQRDRLEALQVRMQQLRAELDDPAFDARLAEKVAARKDELIHLRPELIAQREALTASVETLRLRSLALKRERAERNRRSLWPMGVFVGSLGAGIGAGMLGAHVTGALGTPAVVLLAGSALVLGLAELFRLGTFVRGKTTPPSTPEASSTEPETPRQTDTRPRQRG